MTATAVPSDAEAKATAEAVLELWRVAPDVAAEVIDDAEDAGRWPAAEVLRLRARVARMGPRGMLALERLWDRWATMAGPPQQLTDAQRRDSRRAGRTLYDDITERAEAVFTGAAPAAPFVAWACQQVPGLAILLGDVPRPAPPPVPRWTPPPSAEAAAVAARINKALQNG